MNRLFLCSILTCALSGCFPTPQASAPVPASQDDGKIIVLEGKQSPAQIARAGQQAREQMAKPFLTTQFVNNTRNAEGMSETHRIYLAECDRGTVDDVIGRIAQEGSRRARTRHGPVGTAENALSTLSSSRMAYESAQKECGFDYRREIAQLKAREDAAWQTLFAARDNRRSSSVSVADATALINGATAILGALSGSGGGGGGYGNDDCVYNPSPHAVCK